MTWMMTGVPPMTCENSHAGFELRGVLSKTSQRGCGRQFGEQVISDGSGYQCLATVMCFITSLVYYLKSFGENPILQKFKITATP